MKRADWEARIAKIRELREGGMTQNDIAKTLGMYRQHVWRICRDHAIRGPKGLPRVRPVVLPKIDPVRAAAITEYKRRYWGASEKSA